MTITPEHWLSGGVMRDVIAGGAPMPMRRLLVIHFTAGMSARSSIDYWRKLDNGICAHLVIDRDGTITQCRAFDRTCGHAGVSRWRDPQIRVLHQGCNAFSIGIELANAGDRVSEVGGQPKAFGRYPCPAGAIAARHRNGGPKTWWECYPAPQLDACFAAARVLVQRYHLDDICGHEDIAPERKNDPGPAFPMEALRMHCGFKGLSQVHRKA